MSFLLTDGRILCQHNYNSDMYVLTPDSTGSYLNGTWSAVASLPSGYGPLYYSSAVLPDGRVIMIGGEYNTGQGQVWTGLGAVYDPVTDKWTSINQPANFNGVGDAQCAVLPNGKFVLASFGDTQMAVFNEANFTWTALNGANKQDRFDEEGWTLLPEGSLLTCDALNAPHAEKYLPSMDKWISAGNTPQSLEDPGSQELGPQVLMPNGKLIAFGATGHNAVYTPGATINDPGSWVSAPDFPGGFDIADGPACLLPNGNVLCDASPGVFNTPTHFYEYDGTNLNVVPSVPNASGDSSYVGNFIVLPTGQVLFTDFSNDVQLYTPSGGPKDAWRPTITSTPIVVAQGQSFTLTGTQLNGLSQCNAYGDDSSNAENYPLVQVKTNGSGHLKFWRTHDPSTMAVATGNTAVTTNVVTPLTAEVGASTLNVVTNGITSKTTPIFVVPQGVVAPTSYGVDLGAYTSGAISDVYIADGSVMKFFRGPINTHGDPVLRVHFIGTSTVANPTTFKLTVLSNVESLGTAQTLSLYNYTTNAWEDVDVRDGTVANQTVTISATGTLSRFVKSGTHEVQARFSYGQNGPLTVDAWHVNVDQFFWTIK